MLDKTGAVDGVVSPSTGKEFKVTLADGGKHIEVTSGKEIVIGNDNTVTVPYTYFDRNEQNPATQISVVITDKIYTEENARVLYYDALETTTIEAAADGTGTIKLPDDLPEGYRTYILLENINDGHHTDYASNLVEIPTIQEDEPKDIYINYDTEELSGFIRHQIYTLSIDGMETKYTFDDKESLTISEEWMGKDVKLIRKSENGRYIDSEAYEFHIPERPKKPNVTAGAETIAGKNDGYLSGITDEMEYLYKEDESQSWKAISEEMLKGDRLTGLAAGNYMVRYASRKNAFKSAEVPVSIAAGKEASYWDKDEKNDNISTNSPKDTENIKVEIEGKTINVPDTGDNKRAEYAIVMLILSFMGISITIRRKLINY